MAYYNSVLVVLAGSVDGVNRVFTTPSRFVSASVRAVVNGQVYESDDDNYGWTELTDQTIEFTNAPLTGDVVQAFYQDLQSEHPDLLNVRGSPFDPNGVLP